jgi:hypothetical protein
LINCILDEEKENENCDYCFGKRNGEKDLKYYYRSGFTSGKFRTDDFERLLNLGATRSGNFIYIRDQLNSCCEVYQYRVDVTKA